MLQTIYTLSLSFTYRLNIKYTQEGLNSFIDSLTTTTTAFIQYAKNAAAHCLNNVPNNLKPEVEREHAFIYYCFRRLISLECQKTVAIMRAAQLGELLNMTRITST